MYLAYISHVQLRYQGKAKMHLYKISSFLVYISITVSLVIIGDLETFCIVLIVLCIFTE